MLDTVQNDEKARAWADIKDSQRTKRVLVAQAKGIEDFQIGDKKIECLKLNYRGIYGYLPKQFIDNYEFKGLTYFLGKYFEFVVDDVSFDTEKQIFIANRIKALEILSQNFWKTAKEGEVYSAFVRGIDQFNLYLLVEGVPTMLHRSEYSYSFVEDLREELEIGDTINVKILRLVKPNEKYLENVNDPQSEELTAGENGLLQVSARVLQEDPWKNITDYEEKGLYHGTITKIHVDHGLFIELEPGLTVRTNFPPEAPSFKVGQSVPVKLIEINPAERKIKAITIVRKQGIGKKNQSTISARRGLAR
ncbi:S1 RNA-binding domain-containing protein [Aneurinibacillus thermoaerophilus]|uniref:S1 RNA-binding domain-containing protein n=1 Tax=Aneurinibacillus thermoaerophilus TaxID=143495 RepID=UPI002E1FA38F|nr:S1 RNA-binding domain-containing protein [Aneurinibacillus thermoaerophilus]MED0677629.1 S1 RNA-binding domain-containing protein [Aneurinibacillus thermoaerophilus]